ncbi:hypothetical protein MMC31_000384 [Peltigera leucophlebia]|nr:hypothetical protein [Peltigera leucophlebia]
MIMIRVFIIKKIQSKYIYSRQSCRDAALQILQHQSTLHQETQPGGQLFRDRWKGSSLVNHDFLLAATILCLDLDRDIAARSSSQINGRAVDKGRGDGVIHALCESYKIWLRSSKSSREAQKAAEAWQIVLEKVKMASMTAMADGMDNSELSFVSKDTFSFLTDSLLSSKNQYSHGSSPMTPANDQFSTSIPQIFSAPPPSSTEISNFVEMANGFDWEHWDSQFQGQNFQELLNSDSDLGVFEGTFSA